MPPLNCDLCEDATPGEALILMQRCHFNAPLRAYIEGDTLILQCYVPECAREVWRCQIVREEP